MSGLTSNQFKLTVLPLIYAHRGSTILAPENTQAAFDLAVSWGCDVLETDVRISRDKQVVVTHDATLVRTTNGHGSVSAYNLSALKQLDAGHRFRNANGQPYASKPCPLLSLGELFELYPTTNINIDIKDSTTDAAQAVANAIIQSERYTGITVGSFHASVLQHFRRLLPDIKTAALKSEVANLYFRRQLRLKPPRQQACEILQIPESYWNIALATEEFVQHVHSQGLEICFWTINDPAKMKTLAQLGANGIVTDRPDLAAQVFNRVAHTE